MLSKVLAIFVLASSACAAAIPNANPFNNLHSRAAGEQAAKMLLEIAPLSASCTGLTSECATADQAAPYLIKAFMDYKITNVHEMAAVLSLIATESGEFRYNIHHFPGLVAGQGTRNMQSKGFNYAYASSISELKAKVTNIAASAASMTDDQANQIMALVLPDQYTWASAAWFLTTQCSASVRQGLQAGGQTGWAAYLSQCIGTTATDDRLNYWKLANAALGIS